MSVVDHRGREQTNGPLQPFKRGQYQISLSMGQPFEGRQTGHQLPTTLTYYDQTLNQQKEIVPNNQGIVLVDQLVSEPQLEKEKEHIFTDLVQDTKGFQLMIPRAANLKQDTYMSELTWSLVFGP